MYYIVEQVDENTRYMDLKYIKRRPWSMIWTFDQGLFYKGGD